jgi:predicted nucleotidyltransferase
MPSIVSPLTAAIPPSSLDALCRRWQIRELLLFGSALRDDFSAESDLDLVVDFLPGADPTLYDLATLAVELEVLTGRRIDLHTLRGVEGDRNRLRRRRIVETMVPVYVA